jgi:serine/threonine protein kinase/formylglycine-generating enzyme required for sulfatase activity
MSELAPLLAQIENGSTNLAECLSTNTDLSHADQLQLVLADQKYRVRRGEPCGAEHYAALLPWLAADPLRWQQVIVEEFTLRLGSTPTALLLEQFASRYANLGPGLLDQLRKRAETLLPKPAPLDPHGLETRTLPPPVNRNDLTGTFISGQTVGDLNEGRYRLERKLGQGAFGAVYLAQDTELKRQVAIKVPSREALDKLVDIDSYLREAQAAAALDHPQIVTVYDVGKTLDGSIYVVSKFIDGSSLADWLKANTLDFAAIAKLLQPVAEALHHAHQRRLIHRDIKPANLLIETATGLPFVADFGSAIREEDYLQDGRIAGTPMYMSPEQIRGEGHRLDGRSDLFSLGVVMYRLLTGRVPFPGQTFAELLHEITTVEPHAPRSVKADIPPELERICLKLLRKRASERYASGRDLAEDLQAYLAPRAAQVAAATTGKITPRGLRSFTAADAGFFLDLLPGPRNRAGLPESIAFWKERLEQRDPDQTFTVGLLYGPSGCGKSSLVKAGLIPSLSDDVIAIYIEATPEETESRLLRGLRKQLADCPADLGLVETAERIRRTEGPKVVLLIDQFEQWLYAHRVDAEGELVGALRQCDGRRLQAVLMIRDDFYLAAARLMNQIDVPIVTDQNFKLVDLFDLEHARRVLVRFGESYDRLPQEANARSPAQGEFIEQVVEGLAENSKVVSVRLSLLAEMLKGREWVPATLESIGGLEGIGISFLEETFGSNRADARHRAHQGAVRGVLRALLPDLGTDIKGAMRAEDELREASGYGNRPQEFSELMRILDGELRLLTPTDPEGHTSQSASNTAPRRYYQLTHDYLVPSLREWLTRKQRETKRGRAELKLAERTAAWSAVQETKQLPTLGEWLRIRWLTERAKWKPAEQRLMRAANGLHLTRLALAAAACGVLIVAGLMTWQRFEAIRAEEAARQADLKAAGQVDTLQAADFSGVPKAVTDLEPYRPLVNQKLAAALEQSPPDSPERLKLSLGLLGHDPVALQYVAERLPLAEAEQVPVLVQLLAPYKQELLPQFWERAGARDAKTLLPFASALAAYDPQNEQWKEIAAAVADRQVRENALHAPVWIKALRPAAERLREPLEKVYRDETLDTQVRLLAADTLGDYLSADAAGLFELLADGSERQFVTLAERLVTHREEAVRLAGAELAKPARASASESFKEKLALRQANAGALLLRLGAAEAVWPLLRHSPDPRARSYLIHALVARGVTPAGLIERYRSQPAPEISERRALLLCLGEYPREQLAPAELQEFVSLLKSDYQRDPDPGLHASAEWLLRQWGEQKWLEDWLTAQGEQRKAKGAEGSAPGDADPRQWYVNSQGQTFAILDAGEFQMGSPPREAGRQTDEARHRRRIGRRVAIATSEVTRAQWKLFYSETKVFDPDDTTVKQYSPKDDCPMVAITWYEAAAYCNWLSKQEGIPPEQWCYEPNGSGKYAEGMKVKEGWLELSGYRLPTESEWEYASRAGAATAYSFGGTADLLGRFGWTVTNSDNAAHSVGEKKPNDFGLFDCHGNVFEWCHDLHGDYPVERGVVGDLLGGGKKAVDDQPTDAGKQVESEPQRVLRGGSFFYLAVFARASSRLLIRPVFRNYYLGFRPSRTYH